MNEYLLGEQNRAALASHNNQLVVKTEKTVGLDVTTSYDFNRAEEFRQLNQIVAGVDLDQQTARTISETVYGADDDHLVRRVRSNLKFGTTFQKQLPNGTAVIARQDGTLRITRTPDEYGDLVDVEAATAVTKISKYVKVATTRIGRTLDGAVDKVPELAERLGATRTEVQAHLGSVFSRQLELLSGE